MKDPDYVMKIMASWMAFDELGGEKKEETSWTSVVRSRRRYLPPGSHLEYILTIDIKLQG